MEVGGQRLQRRDERARVGDDYDLGLFGGGGYEVGQGWEEVGVQAGFGLVQYEEFWWAGSEQCGHPEEVPEGSVREFGA